MKEGKERGIKEENKEAKKEAGKEGANLYPGIVYQHFLNIQFIAGCKQQRKFHNTASLNLTFYFNFALAWSPPVLLCVKKRKSRTFFGDFRIHLLHYF